MFSLLKFRRKMKEKRLLTDSSGIDATRLAQVKLVPLPADIWLHILRLTALVEQEHACFARLLLVSRCWRDYSQPALYHTIRLCTSAQARGLAWTLMQGSQGCSEGVGRYVRHLTLATASYNRCDPADIHSILRQTTQLVSLVDQSSVRGIYDDSMAALLAKTLSRLQCTIYPNTVYFPRGLHQLKDLHISLLEGSNQFLMQPFALPLLQKLTLTFFDVIQIEERGTDSPPGRMLNLLSLCQLPALRSVAIHTPYLLHAASVSFRKFFEAHGHRLAVLEFGSLGGIVGNVPCSTDEQEKEEDWVFEQVDLAAAADVNCTTAMDIATLTPNLNMFILSATSASRHCLHPLLPAHPNVRMIGMRDTGEKIRLDWATDSHFGSLFHHFSTAVTPSLDTATRHVPFPKLRYFRDLDLDSDLLRQGMRLLAPPLNGRTTLLSMWLAFLSCAGEAGVSFEDRRGLNLTKGVFDRWLL